MNALLPWLLACASPPYPDYWQAGGGPRITGVEPASVASLTAGQSMRILGSGLAGTSTVVVGTRNATIVAAEDGQVDVLLPEGQPGGGPVDVAVVTPDGMAEAEGAFTWAVRGWDFWQDEVASATLYKVDCPVEVWSQPDPYSNWEYATWCGIEQGYASAYAFDGSGPQPGFSGDQADIVELSTVPAIGEVRVWEPGARRPPGLPYVYGVHAEDETLAVTTARDFARDLAFIEEREELLRTFYYWYQEYPEAFTWHGPVVGVYGPDACWAQDLSVTGGVGDQLTLAQAPGEASGVLLGFGVTEDYGGGHVFTAVGITGSATGVAEGEVFVGDPSGVELSYDGWSGWFFPGGVAGTVGPSDLPAGATWDVALTRLGQDYDLGAAAPLADLTDVRLRAANGGLGEAAHLLAGDVAILRGDDLVVTWDPGPGLDDDASLDFLMVEIRVYDADLVDPYWLTEVARLTAQGEDESGSLTIPAADLQRLPDAVNDITPAWNLAGRWAELSVARHQLRRIPLEDAGVGAGDLVIDFVHVVNAPVMLRDE